MHYLNVLGVNIYAHWRRRDPAEQGVAVRYNARKHALDPVKQGISFPDL
jgi:hypothetical protein